MADRAPLSYLPEIDEESMRANFAYKEALQRLTDALDQRKNRFIDPRWGAAIKAFSTPTRTGSGIEAIGNVAGAVGQAQEEMFKEEQDIAKAQLDVASQGMGMARQRALDKMYQQARAPSGEPAAPAMPGGQSSGMRIAPPSSGGITKEEFMLGEQMKGTPYSEAALKWADYERKNREVRESGVYQDGMFYPTPKGGGVTVRVYGPGGGKAYDNIPEMWAMKLNSLDPSDPEYIRIANMIIGKPQQAPATSIPPTRVEGAAPVMPGATGVESMEDKARREAMEKSERERAQKLQEERDKKAVEREAELSTRDEASRRIFGATERVSGALKQSPNFFGIFEKPTVVAAIGRAVSEGIQTPAGTLNMAGFENAMRQAMPNVSQQDLDNVFRSAADLAEIELAYTQLYMQKQGAITEGERAIVRRLGGSTSNSPGVLKGRMMLLKERSQYDIDRIDAYKKWQAQNPTKTINDFDRSPEAANLKSRFETRLSKIFGTEAALPSSKKGKRSPSERLNDILGGQ